MKATVKLLTVLTGVVLMLTMVGCPKKVIKEEPIPPPPPPDTTPEIIGVPGIELNLATVHFEFDKFAIRAGDADILKDNADQLLKAAEADQKPMVMIEGHCCPIGTAEYNMALGQRRAEAAKSYLVKLGVGASQLTTISSGDEMLFTSKPDEYEMIRRCEFKPEEE